MRSYACRRPGVMLLSRFPGMVTTSTYRVPNATAGVTGPSG
jgi:hypothetical protein